jgi:hypothetical protein
VAGLLTPLQRLAVVNRVFPDEGYRPMSRLLIEALTVERVLADEKVDELNDEKQREIREAAAPFLEENRQQDAERKARP